MADGKKTSGICIRCGKPRIVVDTYQETVSTSVVTYTITECSDPECQKAVNKTLKAEADRRVFIKKEQDKRELQRKISLSKKRK